MSLPPNRGKVEMAGAAHFLKMEKYGGWDTLTGGSQMHLEISAYMAWYRWRGLSCQVNLSMSDL